MVLIHNNVLKCSDNFLNYFIIVLINIVVDNLLLIYIDIIYNVSFYLFLEW